MDKNFISSDDNENSEEKKNDELSALKTATASVLLRSAPVPENSVTVKGPDFNQQLTLHELLENYSRIGFQAHSVGKAIEIINKMVLITVKIIKDFNTLNTNRILSYIVA